MITSLVTAWVLCPAATPEPKLVANPHLLTPAEVWLAVRAPGVATCPAGHHGWVLLPPAGAPFERFCAYGFLPSEGHANPDPWVLESPALEGLADAQVGMVRPQSDGAPAQVAAMAPYLWGHFVARAQLPPAPAVTSARPTVRLAIVDTMPEGAPSPHAHHAPALGALARAVACDASGGCAVDIRHHLGMPRLEDKVVDLVNGGHYGTLWELARGIAAATHESQSAGFTRLVINLSLGWDPAGQAGLPSNHLALISGSSSLPAPLRAVHAALVHARCRGALILAAAGNDDVGLDDLSGPLLPAGWAIHDAPSGAQCTAWYGRGGLAPAAGAPLLYAVGGVNHLDLPLENARPGAAPELVAPASSIIAPGGDQVLTGTSLGTLVASSAAAVVWAIRPGDRADDAYAGVRETATPLGWPAELCARPPCGAARRVSLCAAQTAACAGNASCIATPCPPWPTAQPWSFSMLTAGAATVLTATTALQVSMGAPQSVAGCGLVQLPDPNPWPGNPPCPLTAPVAARNLDTGPQPLDPMCPACFVFQSFETYVSLEIVPEVPGGELQDVFLKLSDGQVDTVYALPTALSQGQSAFFVIGASAPPGPLREAWLQYTVEKEGQPYLMGEPLILE
jgi:hypothetical protein